MSTNPFNHRDFLTNDFDLKRLNREKDFSVLTSVCTNPRCLSYRIISPRGTGKSQLLDTYFSFERCEMLAKEYKKLVNICRFSGGEMSTEAAVFVRLIDAVEQSLDNLDVASEDYDILLDIIRKQKDRWPQYADNCNEGARLLQTILRLLSRRGYSVVLVLDEFHHLACAGNLDKNVFNTMSSITQAGCISYIIVSDYDDEVGSREYHTSSFARIFDSEPAHMEGVGLKEDNTALIELIRTHLAAYPEIIFSENELQILIQQTGGIPGLLKDVLKEIFEIKKSRHDRGVDSQELSEQELFRYALSAGTGLMSKWVKHFDKSRWKTIKVVLEEVAEDGIKRQLPSKDDKRECLGQAGLIFKDVCTQEYRLICPLFEEYIRQELDRPEQSEEQMSIAEQQPMVENHYHFGLGSKFVQGDDVGTTVIAENIQIQQGLTASDVLKLLSDSSGDSREMFAPRLYEQLQKGLAAGAQIFSSDGIETEDDYDRAFHEFSQNIVQDVEVDEENDLDVTPAEMQTLDARFAEARVRCRSDLTDELINAQSERCQFYIKLSVVVEDALNLPGLRLDDFSPHLVLYGKALEQSLRDNLYALFHCEPTLSVYDTQSQQADASSPRVFANMLEEKTYIGNYTFLMEAQTNYLASLCDEHQNDIHIDGQPVDEHAWRGWWRLLRRHVYDARTIRNMTDHASRVSPQKQDLDSMCAYLFGSSSVDSVLYRLAVGKQLHQRLTCIAPRANTSIPYAVKQRLVGTDCRMLCSEVKTNGGLKGVTCDGNYAVNVSPNRVRAFRAAHDCQEIDFAGMELTIHVLECTTQDNKEFFAAEIVSMNCDN